MSGREKADMLLGKRTPVIDKYAPELLYAIPRASGREHIDCSQPLPFTGVDLWHAYELSWLDSTGKPQVRVARIMIPASSPNMVESKSFKLYLNSLNNTRFSTEAELVSTIRADVSATVAASIELELLQVEDASLAGRHLAGECLDQLPVSPVAGEPQATMLVRSGEISEQCFYSHLLRSLCPVTGQPDWATVWVHFRGPTLAPSSLLGYIIAYRQHQEFHEQCVERMFCDIHTRCEPEFLHIQAFYTRRGGLDINPFRSTDPAARPLPRLNRQ